MGIYYVSLMYLAVKYGISIKKKSLIDTTPAIKKFFSTFGLHEFNKKSIGCYYE